MEKWILEIFLKMIQIKNKKMVQKQKGEGNDKGFR